MKVIAAWLLLFVLAVVPVYGEVTRKLISNKDGTPEFVFYSGGKEIARHKGDTNGTIIKRSGTIPDGLVKQYYDDGSLFGEWNYKGGALEGISKVYYPKSGELKNEWSFKNNKLEGISRSYYKSGKLGEESNYKADKLDGVTKNYYEGGKLKSEYNFKDGVREGVSTEYDEVGKVKAIADYKDGKLTSYVTVKDE